MEKKDKKIKKLDRQFKEIMNMIADEDFGTNKEEVYKRAEILTDKYTDEAIEAKGFKDRNEFLKYTYFRYLDLSKQHEKKLKDLASKNFIKIVK